jgi:uncharacterized membrane protein YidH (DUF202 family)
MPDEMLDPAAAGPGGDGRPVRPDGGRDPDYRMSLAAGRTYLAYLRTGLALTAAGVAVVAALPHAHAVGSPAVGCGGAGDAAR